MTIFPTFAMRLMRRAARQVGELSWGFAAALTLGHALSAAAGLVLLGEAQLVSSVTQFVYYYIVTGSSVGYGDFSPTTGPGRLFTALWVIPGPSRSSPSSLARSSARSAGGCAGS